MCLILIKPKGVEMSSKFYGFMSEAFSFNRDGCGFAIKKDGQDKLLMNKNNIDVVNFGIMIRETEPNINDELVIHLRKSTHGKINRVNCHPFAMDKPQLTLVKGIVDVPLVFHNGIIHSHGTSQYSDTFTFVQTELIPKGIEKIKKNPPECLGYNNKFAIMKPGRDNRVELIGDFYKHKITGFIFSTTSYNNSVTTLDTEKVGFEYYENHKESVKNRRIMSYGYGGYYD